MSGKIYFNISNRGELFDAILDSILSRKNNDTHEDSTKEVAQLSKENVGYAPYCPYTEDNKCPSDCYTSDNFFYFLE